MIKIEKVGNTKYKCTNSDGQVCFIDYNGKSLDFVTNAGFKHFYKIYKQTGAPVKMRYEP